MKLKKYTWNNGTQSSPIVLTNDQIKKLIAIGQRKDIESDVRGYVTTSSRKMQKFLKYALENQFNNLNIICDEELVDAFNITLSTNIIKEGTRELISINTVSGINHSFLKWKYDFTNFIIDGDISEQNIKDRIRVEDSYLVVDDPKENASWSVQLTLTAYPSYYSEDDFANIPASSKPDVILTITAKKIDDITITTKSEVPINSKVEISVAPIPADSTKLKGAHYTYFTNTPDILAINTSSSGTTILTKKQGIANLIVTLQACNNTVTKTNSTTFNIHDLRPIIFIIDQRYINNLKDPVGMVSDNYILNEDGSLTSIASSASVGNPSNNTLTWLRKNTHSYVSKYVGFEGVRLKQLDDTNRKKFADGTSATNYISNESGEFDVFLKFGSNIHYKTEPWIPKGQTKPNPDYVAVTIAQEIPSDEDANKWCTWSQWKLIGVYKACQINNRLHSLSGKRPVNNISQSQSISRAKIRGGKFNICDYDMTKLFAFLFYGYYSSLGSQQICGYGTNNRVNETWYPKITGSTDELNMTDTNITNGNGADNPSEDQIIAGIGSDIKSVNFWGLENCWGDLSEWISNTIVMEASRPNNITTPNTAYYVADYLNEYSNIIITKSTGVDVTYTSKEQFLSDYPDSDSKFLAILDKNLNIIRIVDLIKTLSNSDYIEKMIFGAHADIIAKKYNSQFNDSGFTDSGGYRFAGCVTKRSYNSSHPGGGVSAFFGTDNNSFDHASCGARLLYDGDESNVHIIDDATEEL